MPPATNLVSVHPHTATSVGCPLSTRDGIGLLYVLQFLILIVVLVC